MTQTTVFVVSGAVVGCEECRIGRCWWLCRRMEAVAGLEKFMTLFKVSGSVGTEKFSEFLQDLLRYF